MRAIRVEAVGGPEALELKDIPDPVPGEGEACVKVAASGVNFIDVYFPVWDWHFPTFNVADACITVGAVLLFGASALGRDRDAPAEARAV